MLNRLEKSSTFLGVSFLFVFFCRFAEVNAAPANNWAGLDLLSGAGRSSHGSESMFGYGLNFQRSFTLAGLPAFSMGPSLSFRQAQNVGQSDDTFYTTDMRVFSLGSTAEYTWSERWRSGLRYELGRAFAKVKVDHNEESRFATSEATGYEGFSHIFELPITWHFQERLFLSASPFLMMTSLKAGNAFSSAQVTTATSNGIQEDSSDASGDLPGRNSFHQIYGLSLMMGAVF